MTEQKPRTGIRCNGRSGGKRDFVGVKPDHYRTLAKQPRPSLLNRLKICLGLVQRPQYDRLSNEELARIILDAESEQ